MVTEIERILGEAAYNRFKGIDIESLKKEGDVYDFVSIHSLIVNIYESMKSLEKYPEYWNLLSPDFRTGIGNGFKQFITQVVNIETFDPKSGNPNDRKRDIENNIRATHHELSIKLFPNLNIYLMNKTTVGKRTNELQKRLESLIKDAEEKNKEISDISESVKEISPKATISKFSNIFQKQADKYEERANKWLKYSICATTVVGVYLFLLIIGIPPFFGGLIDIIGMDYAHIAIFNALILAISSYLIYQFFRNYNVNMHLHTLNRHRENCLKTFQTFIKSSDDDKTQNTILVQATKAIFEAGETGFITTKSGTNLIEMIMNRNNS